MSMLSRLARLVPRSPALSRSMGSGKVFKLRPSQWDWRFYKDILHLYSMLGLIPVGAVIIGANVLVGPADLVDIPEVQATLLTCTLISLELFFIYIITIYEY